MGTAILIGGAVVVGSLGLLVWALCRIASESDDEERLRTLRSFYGDDE